MNMLEHLRSLVEQKLDERKGKRAELDQVLVAPAAEARNLNDEEQAQFVELRDAVQAIDADVDNFQARIKELEALEARDRERDQLAASLHDTLPVDEQTVRLGAGAPAYVRDEPKTYRAGGGASFFQDAINVMKGVGTPGAAERLSRHMNEVKAGAHGEEFRDAATGAFASLVVPQYLPEMYAENLHQGRITANIATGHDLPEEGMTLTLPRGQTSPAVAAQATENTSVQETDFFSNDLTINVVTYAGQNDISRQAAERGRGVDEVIFMDLAGDYSAKLDADVISGPGSGGRHKGITLATGINAVASKGSGATPVTGRDFLTGLADAVQRVNSTRFLPADAIVMAPRRWGWLLNQTDSNGRPLLSQSTYGPTNASGIGEAAAYGNVGQVLGVPVWTDANVPTTVSSSTFGNEDLVIVARRGDLHLWEEGVAPRQFRFEETLGGNLTVKLVLAGYSAFTAEHHPQGIAVLSGSGLTTPVF